MRKNPHGALIAYLIINFLLVIAICSIELAKFLSLHKVYLFLGSFYGAIWITGVATLISEITYLLAREIKLNRENITIITVSILMSVFSVFVCSVKILLYMFTVKLLSYP